MSHSTVSRAGRRTLSSPSSILLAALLLAGGTLLPGVALGQSLISIEPDLILPSTPVSIRVEGRSLDSSHLVVFQLLEDSSLAGSLVNTRLDGCVRTECTTILGTSPRFPRQGRYDVLLTSPRGVVLARLPDAFEVLGPARVTAVAPFEIPRAGGIEVAVTGENFRESSRIFFNSYELREASVSRSGTRITGIAPPIASTDPGGLFDVFVRDPGRGEGIPLRSGVLYRDPTPVEVEILDAQPRLFSTSGGTLTVSGRGFESGDLLRLGTQDLPSTLVRTVLTTTVPRLPAGSYPLSLVRRGTVLDTFEAPIEVAAPVSVTFVDPVEVCSAGGTVLRVHGTGLRPEMTLSIGGLAITGILGAESGVSICAELPSLPPGPLDLTLEDARGRVLLRGAVTSIEGCSTTPGPQQIEASLAEGTARFTWFNPRPYRSIRIESLEGRLLATLPGDATSAEFGVAGESSLAVCVRGVDSLGLVSKATIASAIQANCERPPPLNFVGKPGELDMQLRGGHPPASVDRCQPESTPLSVRSLGPKAYQLAGPQSIGMVTPAFLLADALVPFDRDQRTTGFTLDEDADALEIYGFYQKIATAAGVELRARITKVFPDDENRFQDEVTFPDVLIDRPKEWNCVTYYRADRDVTDPLANRCPDPDAPGEFLKLTAGEYLLDFYTVGGDPKIAYHIFADDAYDFELLIPGAPCGPYPAAKIVDLTDLRTIPVVTEVLSKPLEESSQGIWTRLQAVGNWLDEDGNVHTLGAEPDSPYFEYIWTIYDRGGENGRTESSGTSSRHETWFQDHGCYYIDLEVRDRFCPVAKKRSYQIALLPCPMSGCVSDGRPYQFLYPAPSPEGIYALAGLNPEPGTGSFEGKRPLEMRVLVAPTCACGIEPCNPATFAACPAAQLSNVQFRLAARSYVGGNPNAKIAIATQADLVQVTDECLDVEFGPKYFHIFIDDLGRIPAIPFPAGGNRHNFRFVWLQAKATNESTWHDVGAPLHMANYPRVLEHGYWTGHFEETGPSPGDRTYRFVVKSAPKVETDFDIDSSEPIDLMGVAEVESYPNALSSGFTSRFRITKGSYEPDEGAGSASGTVMGNGMDGAPVRIQPTKSTSAGIGGGGGLKYSWCEEKEIFKNEFSETLFEAILYTGTIGPIPVTIWASIGLGIDVNIRARTAVFVAPFEAISGNTFAETHFYLLSDLGMRIPCEVRADILGGIGSVSVRLIPSVDFRLDTHAYSLNTDFDAEVFYRCLFDLTMEFEGCINLLLVEACVTVEIPVVDDAYLLGPEGNNQRPPIGCSDGAAAGDLAIDAAPEPGGGVAGVFEQSFYAETSAPVSVFSPDGQTSIDMWLDDAGFGNFSINNSDPTDFPGFPLGEYRGQYRDPSAAFLSNTSALVAWTETFPQDIGASENEYRLAGSASISQQNEFTRQDEIVTATVTYNPGTFSWEFGTLSRIADPPAETPQGSRRPDGRSVMASDLADESAWIAWVRYDAPNFLIQDGTKTIYQPCTPGTPGCDCPDTPAARIQPCFRAVQVPNWRPQLESTGIWVRRLSIDGPISAKQKLSAPGINIEPSLAVSPSGETAYCVWVHDATHTDLVSQNTGRNLVYSRYDRTSDTWSAPLPVIAIPDDYPALLEPSIALKGDDEGLLAFTAIEEGSASRDTGLGAGSRYVYTSRLEGGVFQEPVLIHGKCQKRIYGHWATITWDIPEEVNFSDLHHGFHPEWVMSIHGVGPMGQRGGSGELLVTTLGEGMNEWTDPISLSAPDHVVSNIGATLGGGALRSIHLDQGSAIPQAGGLAGLEPRSFVRTTTRLEPDLAIVHCRLRDACPAPGSRTTATIVVENQGLAGSAITTASGRSATGVKLIYVDASGRERVVASRTLPVLQPAESTQLDVEIEMPHDPVRLRVVLDPNPVDRDPGDNATECFFGAPPVESLLCVTTSTLDDEPVRMVRLSWENPALYDEILIYRDGSMIAAIAGTSTLWIDAYGARLDATRYQVRGAIGRSRSVPSACEVDAPPPPPPGSFKRGDANLDGNADISDAVFVLSWLFLGGSTPRCLDAADSNDSGRIDIADPSYLLNYLFLGGAAPPLPFPRCGVDPSRDDLDCAAARPCE